MIYKFIVPRSLVVGLPLVISVMVGLGSILALAWLLTMAVPFAYAATLEVNLFTDGNDLNLGDGACDSSATAGLQCTLRAAIQEANALPNPDTITLPAGIYSLTLTGSGENVAVSGDLDITGDVTIAGQGLPLTIIDASGLSDRVFHLLTGTVVLSNITIRQGNINGQGGGIYNHTHLTLLNTVVSSNIATGTLPNGQGGGIYNSATGRMIIDNGTVSSNTALNDGGGIYNTNGVMMISSSLITGNQSTSSRGGGLRNAGTSVAVLTETTISSNTAATFGGGLSNTGLLTLTNSLIVQNTALRSAGVSNPDGTATLLNSTVSRNTATDRYGGIGNSRTMTLMNSVISQNTASTTGGGLSNGGVLTVTNTTIASNTASTGAGLYAYQGTARVENTLIAYNVQGGGIYNSANLTLINIIVNSNIATGTLPNGQGGGLYNSSIGTVTLDHSTISTNTALYKGGGIYNSAGNITLKNGSQILNNLTPSDGGGIYNITGTLVLIDSTISHNTATLSGGGIYNTNGVMTISNSAITDNTATTSRGGGFRNAGTSVAVLTETTISNNTAATFGGGLSNTGLLTLTDSLIDRNTALRSTGISNPDGTVTVINSTVSRNTATDRYAGIGNTGVMTLLNSTISGNTANNPGGGIANGGVLTMTYTTIANNTATTGAGLHLYQGTTRVKNSIIANQVKGGDCEVSGGTLTSLGYNLAGDTTCTGLTGPGDTANTNPLLDQLQNNGGDTPTHALLPGSPAINTADHAACPATDQRGVLRPQGAACDRGAYEMLSSPLALSEVRPNQGLATLPNDINIYGTGFIAGATARLGNLALQTTFINDTHLRARVPASLAPATYNLIVTNPDAKQVTLANAYTSFTLDTEDILGYSYQFWTNPVALHANEIAQLGLIVHRQGGQQPLTNVTTRFYLGDPNAGGTLLGDGIIPFLSPFTSTSTSAVSWAVPAPGLYMLYAIIDPDHTINEALENNNIITRPVTVLDPDPDRLAPRVDNFTINNGAAATSLPTLALTAGASDAAPSSGLTSLIYIEYEYSLAAGSWVPVQPVPLRPSDWLTYEIASSNYAWLILPTPGVKYLQAWAVDGAGNISLYPNQQFINYAPPDDSVAQDQGRFYRYPLGEGDQLLARVEPVSGDADLYVWPPNYAEGAPPWVSNLSEGVDEVNLTAPLAGVYQVEVYGFTPAVYQLAIAVTPEKSLPLVSMADLDPDKTIRSQPLLPIASEPTNQLVLPAPPVGPSQHLYLPVVRR